MASRGASSVSPGSGRRQQPLRATVPFQLRGAEGVLEGVLCSSRGEKPSIPLQTSRVRRTSSLDTIIDSYLQGQWPREPDGADVVDNNSKATQTPFPWNDAAADGPRTVFHKRSASWGSAELQSEVVKVKHQLQKSKRKQGSQAHCTPVLGDHTLGSPLNSALLCPLSSSVRHRSRCNRSLEDLELEEVFVKNIGEQELRPILDVPDGHRAPVPPICSSGLSQEMNSLTLSHSPSNLFRVDQSPSRTVAEEVHNLAIQSQLDMVDKDGWPSSPVCAAAASPRPNHSYKFQREPPEGCEKVEAYEETMSPSLDPSLLHYCPDKNKVHFNPTGSAFCPISLVKPLLPKMDFFLRNFPTPSGSGYSGHLSTCPIKDYSAFDGSYQEYDHFSEAPPHRCSPSQATEGSAFHSSLVV